jgi:hypothetical protein
MEPTVNVTSAEEAIYRVILEERIEGDEENPYADNYTVNRGDVAMFGLSGPLPKHDSIANDGNALVRLVRPGDVVDRNEPTKDYAYKWFFLDNSEYAQEEFEELRQKGFRRVTKDEFWVRRWQFDSLGSVRSGRQILLCIPAELWDKYDRQQRDYFNSMARVNAAEKQEEMQEILDRNNIAAKVFIEAQEKGASKASKTNRR